jgi:hypothetical protein
MSGLARRAGRLIARLATAVAEQRAHRALIEAELYLDRYKHSSKNDDDLPIVGLPIGGSPIAESPREQPAASKSHRAAWRRFAGAAVRIAKRIYPALIVLSLLATVLAATIAIRVAIWLPSRLF